MRIQKIESQHRRDFVAIYECESCGETERSAGYDDEYFHRCVIPEKQCKSCGAKAGTDYRPLATKYQDGTIV